MEHSRKQKLLMIVALIVAIASLSIGFAAFSVTLNISSSASVTPSSDTFSVKFSILSAIAQEGDVTPEKSSNSLNATSGVIDNSGMPTIKNLSVIFTEPGQYVDYYFFVVNSGKYDAFLNSVNFLGDKRCIGAENATDSLVQNACKDINVTVSIGDMEYSETTAISGKKLSTNNNEQVKVRLSYDINGSYSDGGFSVLFPDIAFVYSSVDDSSIQPITSNKLIKVNSGTVNDIGSIVSIGNEQFYVIGQEDGNVKLLSMYNLYVGNQVNALWQPIPLSNPTGIQRNDAIGYIWDFDNQTLYFPFVATVAFSTSSSSYSGSIVEGYVNEYSNYLKTLGAKVSNARLITKNELEMLGCVNNSCVSAQSWVYATSYWTGSAVDSENIWVVDAWRLISEWHYDNPGGREIGWGVRPVIEIPLSEF